MRSLRNVKSDENRTSREKDVILVEMMNEIKLFGIFNVCQHGFWLICVD